MSSAVEIDDVAVMPMVSPAGLIDGQGAVHELLSKIGKLR